MLLSFNGRNKMGTAEIIFTILTMNAKILVLQPIQSMHINLNISVKAGFTLLSKVGSERWLSRGYTLKGTSKLLAGSLCGKLGTHGEGHAARAGDIQIKLHGCHSKKRR